MYIIINYYYVCILFILRIIFCMYMYYVLEEAKKPYKENCKFSF